MQKLIDRLCDVRQDGAWLRRVVCAIAFILFGGMASADLAEPPSESRIKAAFLFKFTIYVEWPESAFEQTDAPLIISVVDADEVANELSKLVAGRSVNSRSINVRRLSARDSVLGSKVVFVGSAASGRLEKALGAGRAQGVLVVTEDEDALSLGSVINFVVVDEQVRFDISLPAAERAKLKISSRLLTVARQVVTGGP